MEEEVEAALEIKEKIQVSSNAEATRLDDILGEDLIASEISQEVSQEIINPDDLVKKDPSRSKSLETPILEEDEAPKEPLMIVHAPLDKKKSPIKRKKKKRKESKVQQSPISLKERMKLAAERRKLSGVTKKLSLAAVGIGIASKRRDLNNRVPMNELEKLGQIGIGLFGSVECVQHKQTRELYALKVVSKGVYKKDGIVNNLMMEKTCLSILDSNFIIRLYSTMKDRQCCYFLLEFVNGGEFYELLRTFTYFSNSYAQFYAANVVLAFEHMHNHGVVYRDLKPENLMLTHKGYVKVIDLGFAKKIDDKRTYTYCGTPDYLAPEIIEELGHSYPVDWWTLGVLIFEMLIGRGPFKADTNEKIFKKATSGKVKFPRQLTLHADDIIRSFLQQDPENRLGVDGTSPIKGHGWFQSINWGDLRAQKIDPPHIPSEREKTSHDADEEPPYIELSNDSDGLFEDF